MGIVFINPNSTAEMTEGILASARRTMPGAEFDGWTSHDGPPAIQGAEDGARAVPPLLKLIEEADRMGAAAIVIACFDDTGLAEAQSVAKCPVIGVGQAAYHMARLLGHRFSVVTTLSVSIPVIDENIEEQGFASVLGRVRASEVPVLDLEHDPAGALQRVEAEAKRALAEDGVDCIILGCAGMVRITDHLRATVPARIIDPVEAAARIAVMLAGSDTPATNPPGAAEPALTAPPIGG